MKRKKVKVGKYKATRIDSCTHALCFPCLISIDLQMNIWPDPIERTLYLKQCWQCMKILFCLVCGGQPRGPRIPPGPPPSDDDEDEPMPISGSQEEILFSLLSHLREKKSFGSF